MTDTITERKSKELKERSHSVRNIKAGLKNNDYYGCAPKLNDVNNGLTSKTSKEYNKVEYDISNQKSNSKNLNEQSDYIKNLYKKYLGKENQIQSQKKSKDMRVTKNIISKDENKVSNRLFQQEPVYVKNSNTQEANPKRDYIEHHHFTESNQLTRNKSTISIQLPRQRKRSREIQQPMAKKYKQMLNNQLLLIIGDPRNSIVRCMKNICLAKKIIKMK